MAQGCYYGKEECISAFLLGAMCEYTADRAAEEISKAMNVRGEETEWERLYTFQSAPVITMKVWGRVQEMEAESLAWLCIIGQMMQSRDTTISMLQSNTATSTSIPMLMGV